MKKSLLHQLSVTAFFSQYIKIERDETWWVKCCCRYELSSFNGSPGCWGWPGRVRRSPGRQLWCRTRWRNWTWKRNPPSHFLPMFLTWMMTSSRPPHCHTVIFITNTPQEPTKPRLDQASRRMEDLSGHCRTFTTLSLLSWSQIFHQLWLSRNNFVFYICGRREQFISFFCAGI